MSETTSPDGFELSAEHPWTSEHHKLSLLLEEAPSHIEAVGQLMRGRDLMRLDPVAHLGLMSAALERVSHLRASVDSPRRKHQEARLLDLVRQLAQRDLDHDEESMTRLLEHAASSPATAGKFLLAFGRYLKAAGLEHEQLPSHPALFEAAQRLLEVLRGRAAADQREIPSYRQLEELLGVDAERLLMPGEVWADALLAELAAMGAAQRSAWRDFVEHCLEASASKPSKRWQDRVDAMLNGLGRELASAALQRWLPLVAKGRSKPIPPERRTYGIPDDMGYIVEHNQIALRGLAWSASKLPDAGLARALGGLALACFRQLRGFGARAPKVGNAALWALGNMPSVDAVGQLAVLGARLKGKSVKKQVAKALHAAAAREGVSVEDIEELGVPTHDLREVGRTVVSFGDHRAELEIVDTATVRLRWRDGSGKSRTSAPAAVKREFPEQVKQLRASVKDITALLRARRDRLEISYRSEDRWTYTNWRTRYLDHPLVGSIARRLIWRLRDGVREVDLLWQEGQLRELGGRPQPDWIGENTQVGLWHPLGEDADAIVVWRDLLEYKGITQPFKQAHREVYRPRPEEQASSISTRFAEHILRQHPFHALCQGRGWSNTLRLSVDDAYPPATLSFAKHGLRAEFWIQGIGRYGQDTTEVGTYLYVMSEQLRFHRVDDPGSSAHAVGGDYGQTARPVPFAEVPAFVFSEVLRDVELFVSASSVANDPSWDPSMHEGPLAHYWEDCVFGPLLASGRTRRAVVERILPTLSIADRCELRERCLVVRGPDEHAYEIHLGSGNVRDQAGQVLSVLPQRKAETSSPFLPFEGDATLTGILTKALLLAATPRR